MSELRKRMTEDMKPHGFSKRTQDTCLYAVSKCGPAFLTNPPMPSPTRNSIRTTKKSP